MLTWHDNNIQSYSHNYYLFVNNFFFVGIIQHLKILQIVFRPKKPIKVNYKPSKMKVLKDTFQLSFKLHNYWEKNTHTHTFTNAHIFTCTHKCTYVYMHMQAYTHAQIDIIVYAQTYPYTIHKIDKNLLQLKQTLYITVNYN